MHSLHQLSSLNYHTVQQIWGQQTHQGFLPPFAIWFISLSFAFLLGAIFQC